MAEPKIYSVSQINRYIKGLIENDFILQSFWVKGEISNFKAHTSGHLYFTLKDKNSAINCIMFKDMAELMPYELEDGLEVVVCGYSSVYEKTGQYQIYAQIISPVGMGELSLKFEQLKNKLLEEGLFDEDFKRDIPKNPKTIAVITSPTGAAVRDIINVSTRRNPNIKIKIIPVLVQGEHAVASIVNGIKLVNEWANADVIILGRGGGAIEDLWAFNDEKVARAVFASEIPIISAVGHETDFTITDFVADMRAPTPSAAAELATNDIMSDLNMALNLFERIEYNFIQKFSFYKSKLEFLLKRNVFKRPLDRIVNESIYIDDMEERLSRALKHSVEIKKSKFVKNIEKLEVLSPFSVLKRGFSVTTDCDGNIITSIKNLNVNDDINIETNDGIINAVVKGWSIKNGKEES